MVIYNSTLSILIQWIRVILSGDKEIILDVCDKPYHKNKGILQKWEKFEHLRNYALGVSPWPSDEQSCFIIYALLETNSFNKTDSAIFPMQTLFP